MCSKQAQAIVVLAIAILSTSLACPASEEDADPCDMTPMTELNQEQMSQLQNASDIIDMLQKIPSQQEDYKFKPIVTLTPQQEKEAVKRYPTYFQSKEDLPSLPPEGEIIDVPQKRAASGTQICPAEQRWEAIVIALNYNGEPIQVIQPSSTGMNQWILDESCAASTSQVGSCDTTSRLVSAYVINLSTGDFEIQWIRVYCCVAFA